MRRKELRTATAEPVLAGRFTGGLLQLDLSIVLNDGAHRSGARRRVRRSGAVAAACLVVAGLLAGCSTSGGLDSLVADPARYSVYRCKDLAPRLAALVAREKDLRNLIAKASEGSGGVVIANLSYGAEYESVMGEEKVLRRTAAEKNCDLSSAAFQSDQTIH